MTKEMSFWSDAAGEGCSRTWFILYDRVKHRTDIMHRTSRRISSLLWCVHQKLWVLKILNDVGLRPSIFSRITQGLKLWRFVTRSMCKHRCYLGPTYILHPRFILLTSFYQCCAHIALTLITKHFLFAGILDATLDPRHSTALPSSFDSSQVREEFNYSGATNVCFPFRLLFFAISQLTGGFLLAHVVTYNHYSVEKFPCKSIFAQRNEASCVRSREQMCENGYSSSQARLRRIYLFQIPRKSCPTTPAFKSTQHGTWDRAYSSTGSGVDWIIKWVRPFYLWHAAVFVNICGKIEAHMKAQENCILVAAEVYGLRHAPVQGFKYFRDWVCIVPSHMILWPTYCVTILRHSSSRRTNSTQNAIFRPNCVQNHLGVILELITNLTLVFWKLERLR